MPLVPVPELRRKLALVRTYSPRTSWDLLAVPFGVATKTLKYWGHGSATREPDQVPAEALPVLLGLFAEVLPDALTEADVRRLAFGPAVRLEEEIRSGAATSFTGLMAREGQTATATLFRKPDEMALIEVDEEASAPGLTLIRFGEWFRIEFPMRAACRYAVAVQGVQRTWVAVPSILTDQPPTRVMVPGLDGDRQPRFMRERRDAGLHRFVCLQAAEPFPAAIGEYLRESASFDKPGLDALAQFYDRQPAARRACHMLTVAIEQDAAI